MRILQPARNAHTHNPTTQLLSANHLRSASAAAPFPDTIWWAKILSGGGQNTIWRPKLLFFYYLRHRYCMGQPVVTYPDAGGGSGLHFRCIRGPISGSEPRQERRKRPRGPQRASAQSSRPCVGFPPAGGLAPKKQAGSPSPLAQRALVCHRRSPVAEESLVPILVLRRHDTCTVGGFTTGAPLV